MKIETVVLRITRALGTVLKNLTKSFEELESRNKYGSLKHVGSVVDNLLTSQFLLVEKK